MPLTRERKHALTKEFGKSDKDTGNPEVQIAMLTERISMLTEHAKRQKKDCAGRHGLMKLVGKRRSLLEFLQHNEIERYRTIIKKLGIRK
jgi:small subunit ribosomal protein S15